MTNDDGRKPEGGSAKAGAGASSGVDGNGPKRFSVQRKMAIVARLLRGEPLELVAREANVSIARLTEHGHLRALQPLLAVELLVANDGWVASPVKAVSRRRRGPQARLCVPGMDPGLEVQVLCGASWKQPQAEGNCMQVGASRDNPAWRREAVWGRSRRRAAAPNVSEALCRPGRSGERAKERDAQNPTEIGAVLGPGAAVHPVSLPWEVCMGPRRAPHRA